jgi:hypothetical protein
MTFEQAQREYQNRNQQQPGSCFPPAECRDHGWYLIEDGSSAACPTCTKKAGAH